MLFTLAGIVSLSYASSFGMIIAAVILVGIGSSIFHPEASRISFLASGGKTGFSAVYLSIGRECRDSNWSLLVALIVVPNTQFYIIWFAIVALIGLLVLSRIALWYQSHLNLRITKKAVIDLPNLSQNDCNIGSDFNDFNIFEVTWRVCRVTSPFI
jgi:FSR family fosmidomycin resistance protein-like MFS transporter